MNDLIIRGGLVLDGSGRDPFEADIAVDRDKIVAVGSVAARGHQEIDAKGCIVTPGFVDIHSHYDGQVTWSNRLSPSSDHGVTTVVTGNCGVGFAPCARDDRRRLIELMEGVEDIPEAVMSAGLPWAWESFEDYLNFLEGRQYDMDVGTQLPHSALRVFVMGQRGADRERATDEDLATMTRLTYSAMRAGALGFTTSDTLFHRTAHGEPVPSLGAGDRELLAIAAGIRQAGRGVVEILADIFDGRSREHIERLARIERAAGFGLSFTLAQAGADPEEWRAILAEVERVNEMGAIVRGQVVGRPIAILLGHDLSYNPFHGCPSYVSLRNLSLTEKVAKLRDPALRARLLAEQPEVSMQPIHAVSRRFDCIFNVNGEVNYEPRPDTSIEAQARRKGVASLELAYDALLENDGNAMLYATIGNYMNGTLDHALELMNSENTLLGLGDGGAHYGLICDASYTTHMLTYWARDRPQGRMSLAAIVRKLTLEPARALGLLDRGQIAAGMKADINVINHDDLRLRAPHVLRDLPARGRRLVQPTDGYVATIVSGAPTYRYGKPTGALPGRLVRSGALRQHLPNSTA